MATDLERLVVSLEANVKKYESALSKAQRDSDKAAKKIEKSFNGINPAFALLNKGLAGLAAGVTGGALFGAVKEAIDDLGKIADLADRAQVSTDFIQALGHSVTLAGGSMEDAARAATKFGKELGDMNDKNNELRRIFEANHVSITDQNGALRSSADLFGEFAKLVANAKNPQEAMNLAAKAFGEKVGPKLLTTLMEIGKNGLPAFIKQMKEMGVVLDENLVRKGDDLGDRWETLMTQMKRSFQDFVLRSVEEAEKIRAILKWLATHDAMGNEIIPLTPIQEMEAEVARLTQLIASATEANKDLDQSGGLFSLGGEHQDIERLNEQLSVAVRNLNALRGLTGLPGAGNQPGATTTTKPTVTNLPGPKTTDQFAQDIANFNKRIAVERVELELIDATTFAREKGKVAAELLAEAEKANAQAGLKNTEASIAQKAIIEKLSTEWAQLAADMEKAKLPLREFVRETNNLPKNLNDIALHGLKGFEDALIDLAQGATTAKEAFNKMAKAIIEDITRLVIKMQITAPIALAFSQMINSVTSGGFNLSGARYTPPPGIGADILRNNIMSPGSTESAPGLRVDVKNYGTSQQEFAMKRDANGTHVLEVLIDRAVGRSINTPGTSGDRAMVSRGINFPLQRRA